MKMWKIRKKGIDIIKIFKVGIALVLLGSSETLGVQEYLSDISYDFIVVGAGVAGCTVASRLSESGKYSVLLLEAGGFNHPAMSSPALGPFETYKENNPYTRGYSSVPQNNSALSNDGVVTLTVGRTLGGGSAVNGMVFNRGSPYDWDAWANETQDPSWSYRNMLKFMKRVEDYEGDFPSDQHGHGGPITVSRPKYSPGLKIYMEAGEYLHYPTNRDQNGPQRISITPMEFSKRKGHRVTAFQGYILPYLHKRPNLKLMTHVEVKRVVFDGKIAVGVIYASTETDGQEEEIDIFVRAKREVILSAGAVETPVLLMKSGVGPRDVLKPLKIRRVVDLPVGMNLQDHPAVFLHFVINKTEDVYVPTRDLNRKSLQVYKDYGDGPYSSFAGDFVQAFLATSLAAAEGYPQWPDVQIQFYQCPGRLDIPGFAWGYAARREGEDDTVVNEETRVSIYVMIYLGRPYSRGQLTLNGTSFPLIDMNYYGDSRDMEKMLEAVKMTLEIYEDTPAFQRVNAQYQPAPLSECNNMVYRSDEYWRCYIRQTTNYGQHVSGTVKMGRKGDPTAVVDTKLRVIGLKNLRVVDASIMPSITNANTQAPTYAIAEKTADVILKEWEKRDKVPAAAAETATVSVLTPKLRLLPRGWLSRIHSLNQITFHKSQNIFFH